MNMNSFKTGDKILIFLAAAVTAVVMLWNTLGVSLAERPVAVITRNGEIIRQIDLDNVNAPEYINLNGEINQVILVEKGRIRFSESDCPNQTCVETGWLTKPGEKAVCVPSQVVVKIEGHNEKVDILAY